MHSFNADLWELLHKENLKKTNDMLMHGLNPHFGVYCKEVNLHDKSAIAAITI